jgi:hypothetical protein
MATANGFVVFCVTPSGSVFKSAGTKGEGFGINSLAMHEKMENAERLHNAETAITHELLSNAKRKELNSPPYYHGSHFANMVARDMGILDYEFELSEEDKAVFIRIQPFFNTKLRNGPISLIA